MKRVAYPKWFNQFWEQLTILKNQGNRRTLGSKHEAYKECLKLKVSQEDIPYLLNRYKIQRDAKLEAERNGQWAEDFQDICRWLKHRRFEDEPTTCKPVNAALRSGRRDQAREELRNLFGKA